MNEKKKSKKGSGASNKGFYIALYSCLGLMLALALVIGYNNFARPDNLAVAPENTDAAPVLKDNVLPYGEQAKNNAKKDSELGILDPQKTNEAANKPATSVEIANANEEAKKSKDKEEPKKQEPKKEEIAPKDEKKDNEASVTPETANEEANVEDGSKEAENANDTHYELTDSPDSSNQESASSDDDDDDYTSAEFSSFDENEKFAWPVLGNIVMDYSVDHVIYDLTLDQYRTNSILCIAAEKGEVVKAAAAGEVVSVKNTREDGMTVSISHGNGWITTYSQLSDDLSVVEGDVVNQGDVLGTVASPSIYKVLLGDHLGFKVTRNDEPIDPKNLLAVHEMN